MCASVCVMFLPCIPELIYQIRRVVMEMGEEELKEVDRNGGGEETTYYYMWILNDKDGLVDDVPSTLDLTRTSLHDTTELSLGHVGGCVMLVLLLCSACSVLFVLFLCSACSASLFCCSLCSASVLLFCLFCFSVLLFCCSACSAHLFCCCYHCYYCYHWYHFFF